MVLADGAGTALGVCGEKASPSEVKLWSRTRAAVRVTRRRGARHRPSQPQRWIADRGYDSNAARALLVKRAIEPIIPKRGNNGVATQQGGRKLRRYKRHWISARPNAWLQNFRRLVVRYEHSVKNFEALVHMACALMTLKRVWGRVVVRLDQDVQGIIWAFIASEVISALGRKRWVGAGTRPTPLRHS